VKIMAWQPAAAAGKKRKRAQRTSEQRMAMALMAYMAKRNQAANAGIVAKGVKAGGGVNNNNNNVCISGVSDNQWRKWRNGRLAASLPATEMRNKQPAA